MDGQTLLNLEIFENTIDGSDQGTLFKLINHCQTPFGKRQFKQYVCEKSRFTFRWLCHPLRDAAAIKDRQDAIHDLNSARGLSDEIRTVLKKLPDLERIISRIHAGNCAVKEFVRVIQGLKRVLVKYFFAFNTLGISNGFRAIYSRLQIEYPLLDPGNWISTNIGWPYRLF